MNSVVIIFIFIIIFIILFYYAYLQSKKPSGVFGTIMMKLWNKTYHNLYNYSLKYFEINNNFKILDIGVGNGYSTKILHSLYYDCDILGIDISKDAINQAKRTYKATGISYIQGDICNVVLNKKHYDLICAYQTHFHWENFEYAIKNISDSLKDSGLLLIGCEKNKIKYFNTSDNELKKICFKYNFKNVKIINEKNYRYYLIKFK